MSYPDPSTDLVWVRVDSYTADAAAAVTEAIAFAESVVAIPEGLRARVYGVELEAFDAPASRRWTIYVTLALAPLTIEALEELEQRDSRQDAPRWRRLLR